MLKYRLIFGAIFGFAFVGLIALDSWASRYWPYGAGFTTPPGLFLALGCLVVIPLGLWEMRALLERENVRISMRITVAAALLCMLWPWVEQVAESFSQQHAAIQNGWTPRLPVASTAPRMTLDELRNGALLQVDSDAMKENDRRAREQSLRAMDSSPWLRLSQWFRSVKPHYLVPTILAISLVAAVVMHSRHQRVEGAMANAGGTLLAIVYLGVLPGFFLPICMTHSAWMVLAIVCVVKCADIGAYATGHLLGKHKLIPWLSPGKTVEGFVGGLVFSGLVGLALAAAFRAWGGPRWESLAIEHALPSGFVAGMLLGAVGQLGDLLESLLKRDAGVKDSGVVPGFGGVLDILDSPLLAAPVAYWLLKLVLPPAVM